MSVAPDLLRDGKPVAAVIAAHPAEVASLAAADPAVRAALALAAGVHGQTAAIPALAPLLAEDGFIGRAAAWALANLPDPAAEQAVLAAIDGGDLDQRENGYWSLATRVALGHASRGLGDAAVRLMEAEIAKAKTGGSALADHACRVLAVLGDGRAADLAQQAIEADRFCDRFELNRIRKAVADGGRDSDTIAERNVPWTVLFADHLAAEVPAAPASASDAAATNLAAEEPPLPGADDDQSDMAVPPEGQPGESKAKPVDWKDFLASPEAAALPSQGKSVAGQLGMMLEQLAVRAVGVPLADLSGQEFVALLLQVLPQALPPQHVQMALSPPAINAYHALVKYLARTGVATDGPGLIDAIKTIRKQMQDQIRRAGILNGPDYSDPDDKPA
jgi:hypothetical protein